MPLCLLVLSLPSIFSILLISVFVHFVELRVVVIVLLNLVNAKLRCTSSSPPPLSSEDCRTEYECAVTGGVWQPQVPTEILP